MSCKVSLTAVVQHAVEDRNEIDWMGATVVLIIISIRGVP